jgi:hypothetical protein
MPLVALFQRHFLADSIIYMCVFDFRQAQVDFTDDEVNDDTYYADPADDPRNKESGKGA